MVRGGHGSYPGALRRLARLVTTLGAALTWGAALGWTYPPMGPYGTQPQVPYQEMPQGPYPVAPQAPYQGAPQAPHQGAAQAPYPGASQVPYPGGAPLAYPQSPYPRTPYRAPQAGYQPTPQAPFPGSPYQFRPLQPDNSRGAAPAYQPPAGQMPGYQAPAGRAPSYQPPAGQLPSYQPGYQGGWATPPNGYIQQPAAARQSKPPRLEWTLDETQPYVQQNLLLRLRLISSEGLTTADPDLPGNGDALMQRLAGPTSSTRAVGGNGQREVVTEFVLTLTPLRSGNLELPPPKVTGTRPGAYGAAERYEAVATKPVRLQVRPAMASVRPWLPLRSLTLNAAFDHGDQLRPGQPVTLALELSAVGAHAAQLPNLEDQLVSPDFRVYREQSLTDTNLSPDGRQLIGKRTEYYTLVPQSSGNLRLPEIEVPWWNVETGARQVATLPIRTLRIGGGSGPFNLPASLTAGGSGWGKVWLPLGAVLLVLGGYWAGVFYRGRGPGAESVPAMLARLRSRIAGVSLLAGRQARRALHRLHPAPVAASLQGAAFGLLPESSRFLMVARHANQGDSPIAWCERFEQAARRHLRSCGTGSLPSMSERILSLRPRADRAKLTRLMEQLDAALYGRQDIDFPRWKREFMHQVGRAPALLRPRRSESRIRRAHLPALNPTVA